VISQIANSERPTHHIRLSFPSSANLERSGGSSGNQPGFRASVRQASVRDIIAVNVVAGIQRSTIEEGTRIDRSISDKQRIFGRYTYWAM
jgi:hypothetical protein